MALPLPNLSHLTPARTLIRRPIGASQRLLAFPRLLSGAPPDFPDRSSLVRTATAKLRGRLD
jgi:hypothetical protein